MLLFLRYSSRWVKMLVRRKLDFGDRSEPGIGQPRHSALFACPCQYIENHLKFKPRGKLTISKFFSLPNFPLKWSTTVEACFWSQKSVDDVFHGDFKMILDSSVGLVQMGSISVREIRFKTNIDTFWGRRSMNFFLMQWVFQLWRFRLYGHPWDDHSCERTSFKDGHKV